MFAVFAQYGKGLPTFRSFHKTKAKARKVADRISAAGTEAIILKAERVTMDTGTDTNDTAPPSRPDSKNAWIAN